MLHGQTHWSLSLVDAAGNVLPKSADVAEAAVAGTTLYSGVKTANAGVNMDWIDTIALCTIAEIAMYQGRAAGAVSSVQASHATPASALAHTTSPNDYKGIFNEMVESDLTVIMGAEHPFFDDSGNAVEPAEDDASAFRFLGGRDTVLALTGNEGANLNRRSRAFETASGSAWPDTATSTVSHKGFTAAVGNSGLVNVVEKRSNTIWLQQPIG